MTTARGHTARARRRATRFTRIPHGIDCWVATTKIVIDDEELVFTTAGQFTAQVAVRAVAQWLYAKCESRVGS